MTYEAITRENHRTVYGFVTLTSEDRDQLNGEFRGDGDFDSWDEIDWCAEGDLAFADWLDRKFNGTLA